MSLATSSFDPVVDNRVRLDPGDAGGHVESHFLRANSPDGKRALWVKHTILVPKGSASVGVAEAWAIAFRRGTEANVGAKSTVPLATARFEATPFRIVTGESVLETGRAHGAAESGGHRIEWDLTFDAGGSSHHPFPLERMYDAPLPKSKALTPYPDTTFRGTFRVDAEEWKVDGWPGMQGHNWQRTHAESYAWAHCNSWDRGADGPAWFEALSGRIKLGPITTPWLSVGALFVDGALHRFDGARAFTTRSVEVSWYRWRARLVKSGAALEVEVSAPLEDMAGLHYENPEGSMTYCLNSKLARGAITLTLPGRAPRVLESDRFAFELGTKDPSHGVPMLV